MQLERIGVAGAGTMGAGIAQLACIGGYGTALHDPDGRALEAGIERLRAGLEKGAERAMWSADEASAAAERVRPASALEDLAGCDLVIEAAPERLEVKHELFDGLAEICGEGAVLATNTSSLSVTAIAAPIAVPSRVVGMHFFNPPPLMKLVEVIAGAESAPAALAAATGVAERMRRTPVRASDEIGFIANRCARPYSLEGLRILGDRNASHEQIDRICRVGGGFRMGPFELMDLVGIDVNLAVAKSFWEQSFHEPRWQPSPAQERMVAAGRLGRKTGRGFYEYSEKGYRADDPWRAASADVLSWQGDEGIDLGVDTQVAVLARIVCQLVNEACFALGRGVGSAADIDTAMRLGFNWPRGPLEWGDAIGPARVLAVLDELRQELGEERYRAAPLLRSAAAGGVSLVGAVTGSG